MPIDKRDASTMSVQQIKPPVLQYWGFLLVYYGQAPRLGCSLFIMPIEPFTDTMTNYTCYYRH